MIERGRHVLLDAIISKKKWDARFGGDNFDKLEQTLLGAARAGSATPLDSRVIRLPDPAKSRSASPPGGTAWVGLDESHITLHWYEEGDEVSFAMDAFTCGDNACPDAIVEYFVYTLVSTTKDFKKCVREGFRRF